MFLTLNAAYPLVCKKIFMTLHCERDLHGHMRMMHGPVIKRTIFAEDGGVATVEERLECWQGAV